jgi:hypothetical protein
VQTNSRIASEGVGWAGMAMFAAGKELAALDQHQVRNWTSWHRSTILAMLACAFLPVLAARPGGTHQIEDQLIPLTLSEILRLFTGLRQQPPPPRPQLHLSRWRRRHQAAAQASHYRKRTLAPA